MIGSGFSGLRWSRVLGERWVVIRRWVTHHVRVRIEN